MSDKLKWWTIRQNNSGGELYDDDNVGHFVAFQALNALDAYEKAVEVFEDYSWYCECCGERWSYCEITDESGTDEPEIYGEHYKDVECRLFCENIVLYFADGSKEKHYFIGGG